VIFCNNMTKAISIAVVVLVVLVGGAWAGSRYLVSKLDGTGGVQTPLSNMLQYSSEEGISFLYPDTYEITSRTEGTAERQWDVLVFLPKGYVPPQGGEGPPTIALSIFDNPEDLELEQWIKSDARSNWKLAAENAMLAGTNMGGVPALAYQHSGLYETTAVAAALDGKIYLFSVGWLTPEDKQLEDFSHILSTVTFN
jgi:hypothetical protein